MFGKNSINEEQIHDLVSMLVQSNIVCFSNLDDFLIQGNCQYINVQIQKLVRKPLGNAVIASIAKNVVSIILENELLKNTFYYEFSHHNKNAPDPNIRDEYKLFIEQILLENGIIKSSIFRGSDIINEVDTFKNQTDNSKNQNKQKMNISNRLQDLKQLYQQKLITKAVYEKKQQEILKEL